MAIPTTELIAALAEKDQLIADLLQVLEEERKCIVAMDMTVLEQVDDRKRQLLVQLETTNNRFRQLMRQLGGELNLPEGVTLSAVLPKVDAAPRSDLKRLQAKIVQQGATLEAALAFNRELLQGSLRMINRSLDFFGRMFKRTNTYGQAGSMVTTAADMRLVCKEI